MIPKEKIEEGYTQYQKSTYYESPSEESVFRAGVSFAETELQNIAAEYGVWIETENKYTFRYRENLWKSFHKADKPLTAKEHFELFLKERNEQ